MNTTPFQRALSTLNATCAALDDLRPTGELRTEDIEAAKQAAQRAYRLLTGEDATTGAERMAGFERTAAHVLQYRFALLTFDDAPAPSPKQLRDVTEARKQIRDGMLFLMKNAPERLTDAVISTCENSADRVGLRQFGIALLSAGEDV